MKMSNKISRFLLLFLLLFFASAVTATNISDCTNITGSGDYLLTADVGIIEAEACMNISANDVLFDCAGHYIKGNQTSPYGSSNAGYGIYVLKDTPTTTNITIKNCLVYNFTAGIYLENASYNLIDNTTANDNFAYMDFSDRNVRGAGIVLVSSSFNNLTNIIANNNEFHAAASGIDVIDSLNNTLENITVTSNEDYGIYLSNSNYSTIKNITATDNAYQSIYFYSSSYNNFTNSTIDSIVLDSSYNNTLANLTFTDYGWDAYYLAGDSSGNLIYNCLFNATSNIYFDGLYLNHFNTTQQNGTRIYGNGTQIGGNYWTNPGACYGNATACTDITNETACNTQLYCLWNGTDCTDEGLVDCSTLGYHSCLAQLGCSVNSTLTGYSDTCTDADTDGFCDQPYDAYNNAACTAGVDCSDDTDYLPLSGSYAPAVTTPAITFVFPTPADTHSQDSSTVTVNVTTDMNCSVAILEWDGVNETMTSANATNFHATKTYLAYGAFYYTVYANSSSSGSWGTSATRRVTILHSTPGGGSNTPYSSQSPSTPTQPGATVTPVVESEPSFFDKLGDFIKGDIDINGVKIPRVTVLMLVLAIIGLIYYESRKERRFDAVVGFILVIMLILILTYVEVLPVDWAVWITIGIAILLLLQAILL